MNGALEILRRERDNAAEQIRILRIRIRDLEAAITVLDDQPVEGKRGKASGDLKTIVLSYLDKSPKGATPRELADAFSRDGRPTSDASVSSTLSRLKNESKVANQNGRWFIPTHNVGDVETDSDPSDRATWDDQEEEIPF